MPKCAVFAKSELLDQQTRHDAAKNGGSSHVICVRLSQQFCTETTNHASLQNSTCIDLLFHLDTPSFLTPSLTPSFTSSLFHPFSLSVLSSCAQIYSAKT